MAKKTLLERGICPSGHEIKSVADIYEVFYKGKMSRTCRVCQKSRALVLSRKKRGTPLDQPKKEYKERTRPNRTKATMELIKLVSADPELAKRLLAIAKEQKEVEYWIPT
jgi:hypothetical protein